MYDGARKLEHLPHHSSGRGYGGAVWWTGVVRGAERRGSRGTDKKPTERAKSQIYYTEAGD